MAGNQTVATLIVDKNGRLTTVHKSDGKVGVQQNASNSRVRYDPTKTNFSLRDYGHNHTANAVLDDIAELEDKIAVKAVTGLINEVNRDYPDASRIFLERDNSTGAYQVSWIENAGKESLEDDFEGQIYDLFAARVDVEGSLVKETEYADRYLIEWESE